MEEDQESFFLINDGHLRSVFVTIQRDEDLDDKWWPYDPETYVA